MIERMRGEEKKEYVIIDVKMGKKMRRSQSCSLIERLYEKCEKEARADRAKGIKNKLSPRDLRRISILAKRSYNSGYEIQYDPILDAINDTKENIQKISKATLSRHVNEAGLVSSKGPGSLPKDLKDKDVPRWLARRRSFSKWWKGTPKEHWFVADGSDFGLERKTRRAAKTLHPSGAKRPRRPARGARKNKVHVWCAVGLTSVSNAVIWMDGKAPNAKDFCSSLETDVFPDLLSIDPSAKILQDSSGPNRAMQTQETFRKAGIEVKYAPPYSGDLVRIEKFWANLGDRVYRGKRSFSTKEELAEAIEKELLVMMADEAYLTRLCAAEEAACRKCIQQQGYRIHWD